MSSNSKLLEKALKKGAAVITEAWIQHAVKHGASPLNPPKGSIIRPKSTALAKSNHHASSNTSIPILSLILPHGGPNRGNFKIAIFGIHFQNTPLFRIRIGHLDALDYEFHSDSSVVATIPELEYPFAPGPVLTAVSNDGGENWCNPMIFTVYDADKSVGLLPISKVTASLPPQALLDSTSPADLLAKALDNELNTSGEVPLQATKPVLNLLTREIRLFISSPFIDMQNERDVLVKKVIPKLRRLCMQRDVAFSYVDLRWGVTAQQSESAVSLLLCLREIESCNMFLGFYGERYGWCVSGEREADKNDLLRRSLAAASKEYPWVNEMAHLSVSEIEMRSVIDRKYSANSREKKSWFYLRDPYFVEEVPAHQKHLFQVESEKSQTQLESFKRHLNKAVAPKHYARPTDIAELVMSDVESHLDREFPAEAKLSPLERERFRHDVYGRSFSQCYLPSEIYFNQLDRFISDMGNKPLLVQGASGIGKSALLSNWLTRRASHAPEDIVIHHWVGCSPLSANVGQMLSRILLELKDKLDFSDDKILAREDTAGGNDAFRSNSSAASTDEENFGLNTKKIIKNFLNSLKIISSKYNYNRRRIVIVIDGLDKLDARENAHDLIWLPHVFPKSVRLIVSSSTDAFVTDVMTKRKGVELLTVQPMTEADRKHFVRTYLTLRSSKRLTEDQEFKIAQAPQTAHPLYMKTLLDDLSEYGNFDLLDSKIASTLQASSPSALYSIVLERMESELDTKPDKNGEKSSSGRHGSTSKKPMFSLKAVTANAQGAVTTSVSHFNANGKPKISAAFLSLIWASRRGLLLNGELDQILERKRGFSEEVVTEFFVVSEETLLADCSGLLLFKNADVRSAVQDRYLPTDTMRIAAHAELATWFEGLEMSERKLEELPHHYLESQQYDKLRAFLSDLRVFDRLYNSDAHKFDLLRYWRILESQKNDAFDAYKDPVARGTFPNGLLVGDLIYHLGLFLLEMDKPSGAEFMFQKAEAYYHHSSQLLNVAKVLASLGELHFMQTRHEECEKVLRKAVSIYAAEKGATSQALVYPLDRLGVLYTAQFKIDQAKESLEQALRISESNEGSEAVQTANVYYDLACAYLTSHEADAIVTAEGYLRKALTIKEAALGPWDIEVSHVLLRLGSLYLEQNQFGDAAECFDRSLTIRTAKLGNDHSRVAQTLKHMVTLYEMQEQFDPALEYCDRALAITRKVYGNEHLHVSGILLRMATVRITRASCLEQNILHVSASKQTASGSVKAAQIAEDKKLAAEHLVTATAIRKAFYKPGHRCIVECEKIKESLDELERARAPPPPPIAFFTGGRVPTSLTNVAVPSGYPAQTNIKALTLDRNGVPVAPPPPAPSSSGTKKAAPVAAVINNGNEDAGYLEQLQTFSAGKLNRARDETRDRSDANKQAKAMLGVAERRIVFKKSLHSNE